MRQTTWRRVKTDGQGALNLTNYLAGARLVSQGIRSASWPSFRSRANSGHRQLRFDFPETGHWQL